MLLREPLARHRLGRRRVVRRGLGRRLRRLPCVLGGQPMARRHVTPGCGRMSHVRHQYVELILLAGGNKQHAICWLWVSTCNSPQT